MRRMYPARRGPSFTMAGLVAGVLGLAALAGLAGCTGGGPAPSTPPTAHPGTPATPTTATPSSNPTDLAAAAAIAAVQKLYAEYNAMLDNSDTARYRSAFTRDCGICETNAVHLDGVFAKHQHVNGGRLRPAHLRAVLIRTNRVIVEGDLRSPAAAVLSGSSVVQRFPDVGTHAYTWDAVSTKSGWLVSDVQALT